MEIKQLAFSDFWVGEVALLIREGFTAAVCELDATTIFILDFVDHLPSFFQG